MQDTYQGKKTAGRKLLLSIGILLIVCVGGALLFAAAILFENRTPQVTWSGVPPYLGRQQSILIDVSDPERGLRNIRVFLTQRSRQFRLLDEHLPFTGMMSGGSAKTKTVEIELLPRTIGVGDGKAVLEVEVWDYSLRNWGHGNKSSLRQEVIVDTVAPVISVIAHTKYLTRGGSGIAVYRISKEATEHGVKVGDKLFSGYPVQGKKGFYQALFAIPSESTEEHLAVQARDRAGNQASQRFTGHIKQKKFKKDVIRLGNALLQDIAAKTADEFPEYAAASSPLNTFIAVNTRLRESNEAEFKQIFGRTAPEQLWQGAFVTLPNAATRAGFGERRSYVNGGREITRSVHLGLDMASFEKSSVPAANNGIVAEIRQLGIYGLTLVLDHGQGLFSVYAHLSAAAVQKGERVQKGQTIARTGSSGLAFGDHLHFGMAVQGVFVNPVEWIDNQWIEKKIDYTLAEAFPR